MPSPLESTEDPSSVREAPRDAVPLLLRPSTVYAALASAWVAGVATAYPISRRAYVGAYGEVGAYDAGALWETLGWMGAEIAVLVLVLAPWSFAHRPAQRLAGGTLVGIVGFVVLGAPRHQHPLQEWNGLWIGGVAAALFVAALAAYPWERRAVRMRTQTEGGR